MFIFIERRQRNKEGLINEFIISVAKEKKARDILIPI